MSDGIPFSYLRALFAKSHIQTPTLVFAKPRTGNDLLSWAANQRLKHAHSSYAIAEKDLSREIFGSFLLMLQALTLIASLLTIWFSLRYVLRWHAVVGWPHAPATESAFNSSHIGIRSGRPGKSIPTKYIQIVCNLGFPATQIPVISSAAVAAGGL